MDAVTSCGTCRWSEPIASGDDGLPRMECRRYPPQIIYAGDVDAVVQAWPNVHADDYRGVGEGEEVVNGALGV